MKPTDGTETTPLRLQVGGLTRAELRAALRSGGVLLNAYAETLLDHAIFDLRDREEISVVQCALADLHLSTGATLPEVFSAAQSHGFELAPPDTGPYLRLAMAFQANAPDSVLSAGTSPAGALTVASAPLTDDASFPKGFYLRVIEGEQWLRGFRCEDEYRFSPDDRFAFQVPGR